MAGIMFSDTFKINALDYDPAAKKKEKKFDKVSRIDAESEAYSTALTLDVNMEVFPLLESEKIDVLLCETLEDRDSTTAPTDATKARTYDPSRPLGQRAHEYDYIMSGKIFKYVQHKEHSVVYASFGGLLMSLKGETNILAAQVFPVDTVVYLFVRKV